MTTLILKWPDNATAVACGKAMGTTSEDESGENVTAPLTNGLNVNVIGEHSYVSDNSFSDNSDPENPVITSVSGTWAMVWLSDASIVSSLMEQLPEALRPEIVWRSDVVDTEGEPVPRPPINLCPQRVVA